MDAKPENADVKKRVIKRYTNRKLYDTKDSRYVTLLQIAEIVRGGEEVQIIDNTSKEDLTQITLAQIIFEEQKGDNKSVPLATLRDLLAKRTEKVLSDLREGPIGRFIPKRDETPKPGEVKVEPKATLVEQARGTLEELQAKIDERVKAVLPTIFPWQELEGEVKRLQARVDDLEKQLKNSKK